MDPRLPATIASGLQDDIRTGRLPPGSVLRQEELAGRFGVSRQPIRQVIEILRGTGLVAPRRDRSVEVVAPSADAQRELLAVRLLLEQDALARAIPNLHDSDLLQARQIQERLEQADDPAVIEELDTGFHAALYQPCGNLRLLRLIETLRREDLRPYASQPRGSSRRSRWAREHRSLLRACAARDAAQASALLATHLSAPTEGTS
jgi:DNA-binding GntR family transcriptional regulator